MTDQHTKMLQAILAGQSSLRTEITHLREEMIRRDEARQKDDRELEERLTARLNLQGKQLNVLDEDAPSGHDFRKLEKRVEKIEHKLAQA